MPQFQITMTIILILKREYIKGRTFIVLAGTCKTLLNKLEPRTVASSKLHLQPRGKTKQIKSKDYILQDNREERPKTN